MIGVNIENAPDPFRFLFFGVLFSENPSMFREYFLGDVHFSKMLIFPRVFTVFTDPPLNNSIMFTLDCVLLQCWD